MLQAWSNYVNAYERRIIQVEGTLRNRKNN